MKVTCKNEWQKFYLVTIPLKLANTLVLLERMMVNLYANFKMSFLG